MAESLEMNRHSGVEFLLMFPWITKNIPGAGHIRPICREASTRSFFRLDLDKRPYILVLYPEPNPVEINRIHHFTSLYQDVGVRVPLIHDTIGNRGLLLEDLGVRHVQFYFKRSPQTVKREMVRKAIRIISRIATISPQQTALAHDLTRQRFEMDFFITHFLPDPISSREREDLRAHLYRLTEASCAPTQFSHRDFHSRNLIFSTEEYGVIDFQDSMRAHPLYDMASFLWDAYLPWTASLRNDIISKMQFPDGFKRPDLEIAALQRTIKALGTFAYQVKVRKNLHYARYISRVIESVILNPQFVRRIPDTLRNLFNFEK